MRYLLLIILLNIPSMGGAWGGSFTFVELNCENLFDCRHDSLKEDWEFLPEGAYHWTPARYWEHQNNIAKTILSLSPNPFPIGRGVDSLLGQWATPDMVALCEVENDSVVFDLTRRSLLRNAGYEYVMTDSPDLRGIDVALLYSPFSFRLESSYPLRVSPVKGMRPTRDILYAVGLTADDSRLHVFVVHAPSRSGGEYETRPHRKVVYERLRLSVDSVLAVEPEAQIIVAGDFNDYRPAVPEGLTDVSLQAKGSNGAEGTYKYRGEWGSLDHILISNSLIKLKQECYIGDALFLLTEDRDYGGVKPHRNYTGPKYQKGFSDHLPLVLRLTYDTTPAVP